MQMKGFGLHHILFIVFFIPFYFSVCILRPGHHYFVLMFTVQFLQILIWLHARDRSKLCFLWSSFWQVCICMKWTAGARFWYVFLTPEYNWHTFVFVENSNWSLFFISQIMWRKWAYSIHKIFLCSFGRLKMFVFTYLELDNISQQLCGGQVKSSHDEAVKLETKVRLSPGGYELIWLCILTRWYWFNSSVLCSFFLPQERNITSMYLTITFHELPSKWAKLECDVETLHLWRHGNVTKALAVIQSHRLRGSCTFTLPLGCHNSSVLSV